MKTATVIVITCLVVPWAISAGNTAETNGVRVLVRASSTVFKQMPAFAVMEVRNGGDQPIEFPQCFPLQRAYLPFLLRLQQAPGGRVYRSSDDLVRRGFIASLDGGEMGQPTPKPTWQLLSGESRRFLVNLAWNLRQITHFGSQLTGGEYSLTLGVVKGRRNVKDCVAVSAPMEFRVVDFPAQELGALTNKTRFTEWAAPDLEVWGRPDPRKEAPTPEDCKALKTKELRETVALSALFHHILTAKDISTVPVKEYRPFIGEWLSPELDQIEYEILLAKGEKEKAATAKEALLQRCPAMRFWADAAERGEGLCHRIRLRDLGP